MTGETGFMGLRRSGLATDIAGSVGLLVNPPQSPWEHRGRNVALITSQGAVGLPHCEQDWNGVEDGTQI